MREWPEWLGEDDPLEEPLGSARERRGPSSSKGQLAEPREVLSGAPFAEELDRAAALPKVGVLGAVQQARMGVACARTSYISYVHVQARRLDDLACSTTNSHQHQQLERNVTHVHAHLDVLRFPPSGGAACAPPLPQHPQVGTCAW